MNKIKNTVTIHIYLQNEFFTIFQRYHGPLNNSLWLYIIYTLYEQLKLVFPSGTQGKSSVLDFYYCVTNCHKFNSLKQHTFIIIVSMNPKSCHNLVGPLLSLRRLQSDVGWGFSLIRGVIRNNLLPHWHNSPSSKCSSEVLVFLLSIS